MEEISPGNFRYPLLPTRYSPYPLLTHAAGKNTQGARAGFIKQYYILPASY
ncbi:hypothetical protein Rhal01_02539 [Rubritalea halochordaticola]|uniref:Uncharacterized protein n=1 Tax=Rubritalea halochordaticola TaxID=714537 RepID=A0ABP9V5I4_9BACT